MPARQMEASIIFESHLPDALRRALVHAGEDGFVASMPQLLHARVEADFDNIIWNTWFTANSEECVATTAGGSRVVVIVHGGGILGTPERIRTLYHASVDRTSERGFTGLFAAKVTPREARDIAGGLLPDGTRIPVYSFDDFRRDGARRPRRYAVVMDFDTARNSVNGYEGFDALRDDPMLIARAGGTGPAAAYLDKARQRGNADSMGSWHSFNAIDADQPQCCLSLLYGSPGGARTRVFAAEGIDHLRGLQTDFGLRGDTAVINMGRFVAVAPGDAASSVRHLSFAA